MYNVNDVVVHENGGVYRIAAIGKPDFVDGPETYYTLRSVGNDESTIYVKLNNDKVYMRPVMSRKEAKEYLEQLPEMTAEYEANNKERERLSEQILKSCEVSQYLKLMKAILLEQDRKKKNGKKLNCSDEKNLQRAEKMLISEFAIVFNITVEKQGIPYLMLFLKKKKMRDWQGTGMYRGAEAVPQNYFISKK